MSEDPISRMHHRVTADACLILRPLCTRARCSFMLFRVSFRPAVSEEETAKLKGKKARLLQMQKIWAGQGPMQKLGDLTVMLGIAGGSFPVLFISTLFSSPSPSALCDQRHPRAVGLSPTVCFLGCSLGSLPVSQANDEWER